MQRLDNLTPLFLDARGALLDAGRIYIGTASQDPELSPKTAYWDTALTQIAPQPLRTLAGVLVNGENPANVYLADGDYSQRVRDADSTIISAYSFASAVAVTGAAGASYQPASATLALLAALTTTAFGRGLLTLADVAALKALIGNIGLALTGGTMSGNIVRAGAGVHAYFADAAMTGGRIFITAVGAADPTSQPGDIWLQY